MSEPGQTETGLIPMKFNIVLLPLIAYLFFSPLLFGQTDANEKESPERLRLMSFNIRNGRANDGVNKWDNRKDFVCDVVKEFSPDIVGLQEAFHFQLQHMLKKLPSYSSIGEGRDGGTKGEYSAILYRSKKFSVKESGTFWLSDTPEKKSRSWGNRYLRICTWARLLNNQTKKSFYIFNTHFDHQSQNARVESAKLIAKRIAQRKHPDPFVLMGDLNAGEDNPVILFLKGKGKPKGANKPAIQLKDTFRTLHPDAKDVGTGGGFQGRTTGPKIDYVLIPSGIETIRASIIRTNRSGKYPSDHFPVFAEIDPSGYSPKGNR